jgi:hypothetical protein
MKALGFGGASIEVLTDVSSAVEQQMVFSFLTTCKKCVSASDQ